MRELLGYRIHATDGEAGSIEDFIIEDTLWGVHHAIIALHPPPVRSILLPPESIRSISWRSKAAWMNLSHKELENCPAFDPATPVNQESEYLRYDYYGRRVYPPPPSAAEIGPEAHKH